MVEQDTHHPPRTSKLGTFCLALFCLPVAPSCVSVTKAFGEPLNQKTHHTQLEGSSLSFTSTYTYYATLITYLHELKASFHASNPIDGTLFIEYNDGNKPTEIRLKTDCATADFKSYRFEPLITSIRFESDDGKSYTVPKSEIWALNNLRERY